MAPGKVRPSEGVVLSVVWSCLAYPYCLSVWADPAMIWRVLGYPDVYTLAAKASVPCPASPLPACCPHLAPRRPPMWRVGLPVLSGLCC